MVAVFLTINDELANAELEKIGEVLPRIEVLMGFATLVNTYWPPGEGGGESDCRGGQCGGSSSSGQGLPHLPGGHFHLDLTL